MTGFEVGAEVAGTVSVPEVGTKTTFEVPRARGRASPPLAARAEVTAVVSAAYVSDGSYFVRYEGGWSVLEGDGALPEVGTRADYEVVSHLDTTRRTLLRPART